MLNSLFGTTELHYSNESDISRLLADAIPQVVLLVTYKLVTLLKVEGLVYMGIVTSTYRLVTKQLKHLYKPSFEMKSKQGLFSFLFCF